MLDDGPRSSQIDLCGNGSIDSILPVMPNFIELVNDDEIDLLLELEDVLPADIEDVAAHTTIEHDPARQLLGSSREPQPAPEPWPD